MLPLRAPTIRSVPEMVSAKLWRAPVRTFSTPSSSDDADRDRKHGQHGRQPAVAQRLQGEAQDDHGLPSCRCKRDLVEPHHPVETGGQALDRG